MEHGRTRGKIEVAVAPQQADSRIRLEVAIAGTLLFVHGTGVRKAGYERNLEAIRVGCADAGLGAISLVGIPWGEQLGTSTELVDDTLPLAKARAAVGAPLTPADEAAASWGILLEDPLFELRVAGVGAPASTGGIRVGSIAPEQQFVESVRSIAAKAASLDLESAGISADELAAAARAVAESDELAAAATAAAGTEAAGPEFADAAARAIVASVLTAYRASPPGEAPTLAYSAPVRDELVEQLANLIAPGTTRGLGSWLGKQVGGFVAKRATSVLEARRGQVSVGSLPFLGDILYYQKRGEEIRGMVEQAIAEGDAPVVVLGHSLGGIVLVDLLTQESPPHVDAVITVGSQSPLFYAIDALDRMRRHDDGPQPRPFSPWLNIYDRADILSFVAARVFPGDGKIRDEEIASGVPFPSSHSAYFHQPQVFELIHDFWPK